MIYIQHFAVTFNQLLLTYQIQKNKITYPNPFPLLNTTIPIIHYNPFIPTNHYPKPYCVAT